MSGTDTSSGIGVLGASNTGTGVRGTSNTNYGMKGSSTSAPGIYGISANSYGVSGQSTSGTAGVLGTTSQEIGVYGDALSAGTGVEGQSASGTGVYGTTTNGKGVGVFGYETSSGSGVIGQSGTGAGVSGYGNAGGIGGYFNSSYEALVGESSAFPLLLSNGSGTTIFYVDSAGDVFYHGGLHTLARTASGANVTSFTAKMTSPTVEDTGTAQLVGGVAAVRLDQTFAASIDPTLSYRVFLTPNGDTRGLFVPTKSAAGFIVREAQGGHSTVSFDYRIVATALGEAGQRMTASGATVPPHVLPPVAPPRPSTATP